MSIGELHLPRLAGDSRSRETTADCCQPRVASCSCLHAADEGSRSSEEPSPPVSSSLPSTKQGTKRGVLSVRSSPEYAATVAIAERERRTALAAGGLVADAGKGCKSPTLPPPPFTHHRKTGDDGAVTDAGRSEKRVSPPSLLHDAGNRACRCSTADALMSIGELHLPSPPTVVISPSPAKHQVAGLPAFRDAMQELHRRRRALGKGFTAVVEPAVIDDGLGGSSPVHSFPASLFSCAGDTTTSFRSDTPPSDEDHW
nr:hypothetical protein Iba_scaffold7179CG0010 [Ipomoea batatas]